MVTLQPIAMLRPSADFIYEPSRLQPQRRVTEAEFVERYADHPHSILVKLEGQEARPTTAYGYGMECWYIVA